MNKLETINKTNEQSPQYSAEQARYDNLTTWLAETLDGHMRTPFEYQFDGQEVYGHDGSPLKAFFDNGIIDAQKIAEKSPNLVFELRRRIIEREEYDDVLALARDEAPNSLIVVSDFPVELMDAKTDIGGYNVTRKQTMLRIITKASDGTILMRTQTLDGSDRTGLEALYAAMGQKVEPGELLGQRITCDIADDEQELIVDQLMGVYDRSLARQYGGEWYAGRMGSKRETYSFVRSQTDLLQGFLAQKNHSETDMYNLAAAMQARFKKPAPQSSDSAPVHYVFDHAQYQYEMQNAGQQARNQGKTFSACGSSLGAPKSTTEELDASGLGNKTDSEEVYKFDKDMHCVVCQAPPAEGESKKKCGPCGICENCDGKYKKTGKF